MVPTVWLTLSPWAHTDNQNFLLLQMHFIIKHELKNGLIDHWSTKSKGCPRDGQPQAQYGPSHLWAWFSPCVLVFVPGWT